MLDGKNHNEKNTQNSQDNDDVWNTFISRVEENFVVAAAELIFKLSIELFLQIIWLIFRALICLIFSFGKG
ncbi:hypothetical protein [Candidatus Albibeggiatoa sp. nov. NOAA]|uniref:hypothetical protein n=1 Tax=Candidatus Albibeggiatoa sp. nov. NOAA TaxID=3162724 RepID=UPI0032F94535|nr:hypothetical protein [Thiotrichaceae bacterium]